MFFLVISEVGEQLYSGSVNPEAGKLGKQYGIGNKEAQQTNLLGGEYPGEKQPRCYKTQNNTYVRIDGSGNALIFNDTQFVLLFS